MVDAVVHLLLVQGDCNTNGPTLICMETYKRLIISQPEGISTLPGCPQTDMAMLQKPVTSFMTSQYNHLKCFKRVSALATP
jgi:hypothetical protein